jgi:hypothetical protein
MVRAPCEMATCPRCKGHLTENHRCPRSVVRRAIETTLAAAAGGAIALVIFSLIDPEARSMMDGVLLVGGALVGVGLERWLRR